MLTGRRLNFPAGVYASALLLALAAASCSKKQEAKQPEAVAELSKAAAAAPSAPINPETFGNKVKEFKDPKGFFVADLPDGYTLSDKSVENSPKLLFTYGASVNLMIMGSLTNEDWDAEYEMANKVDALEQGIGVPAGMHLSRSGLAKFGGMAGFETVLSGRVNAEPIETRAFTMAGKGKFITVQIACRQPGAMRIYDKLSSAITNSLRLPSAPAPAKTTAPSHAAPKAPTSAVAGTTSALVSSTSVSSAVGSVGATGVVMSVKTGGVVAAAVDKAEQERLAAEKKAAEEKLRTEWDMARAQLKTGGIMKMGAQWVVLVNNEMLKAGDTVSVKMRDKTYVFRVSSVTRDRVNFDPLEIGAN